MNSAQKYRNNKLAKTLYKYTPKFINDIIFSLFGLIKYFEYLRLKKTYLLELMNSENFDRNQIINIQNKKLKKIIIHAYENTQYYKEVINRCNINPYEFSLNDLNKLPVLTKELLLSNKNKLIASNHEIYNSVSQSSGGTTGTTINFLMDKENYLFKEAEALLHWERHGYIPRKTKAVMYRAGILFSDGVNIPNKPWRNDYARNLLYISSYYSSDKYYQKYYLKLKKWNPEFMHVLPSAGYLFANYLNENSLNLNFRKIFTASEMLYPSHREAMEKAFNCKVVDHYGHGEPGVYAAGECKKGNYHICETNTIFERDIDNSIIETSLNNFSMPFIRYKVGDKIKKVDEGNCSCGLTSQYITGIVGRESEVIYTGDGRKISSIGFDQIFKDNNILMGQIVQKIKGELELNIVPSKTFDFNNKKKLLKELESRVGRKTLINFNKVDVIAKAKSGKYNLIVSKIK